MIFILKYVLQTYVHVHVHVHDKLVIYITITKSGHVMGC